MKKALVFAGMGLELAVAIPAAFWFGGALEESWGYQRGILSIGLSIAVLVGWLLQVIFLVQKIQKNEESEKM